MRYTGKDSNTDSVGMSKRKNGREREGGVARNIQNIGGENEYFDT